VVLEGLGGEVGRAFYWKEADLGTGVPSVDWLLERLGWESAPHPAIRGRLETWLQNLPPGLPLPTVLDPAYIEFRLACAMGPSLYEQERHSIFTAYPINGRPIFSIFLSLPPPWRFAQGLYEEVLRQEWPELKLFPLHKDHWTGVDRYRHLLTLLRYWRRWTPRQRSAYLRLTTAGMGLVRMVFRDLWRLPHFVRRSLRPLRSRYLLW